MFKATGLTGYIMVVDCKVVSRNTVMMEANILIPRQQLVFSCVAGDGHPLYAESMWRTDTDECAFRKTKLWSIINGMDLFAFARMVEGVRICSPGFVTVDHHMDFNSWLGMDSKNVISGSIATTPEGLTPAQKFETLPSERDRRERSGVLAQPVSRGDLSHSCRWSEATPNTLMTSY